MMNKEGMMNKVEILDFLNSNPVCHLATIDGDQPRVRGMLMYRADENGILFHTGSFKPMFSSISPKFTVFIP